MKENGLSDDQVCEASKEEYDLGYWGGFGGPYIDEVQKAARMTRTGEHGIRFSWSR